jgi:hypothetical protein
VVPVGKQKRLNLTKTVRKVPITASGQKVGHSMEDRDHKDIKYDEEHPVRGKVQGPATPTGACLGPASAGACL